MGWNNDSFGFNFRIMKVGILGGSFNPPHLGHVHISQLAIKKLNLNQVWWVVTEKNPLKEAVIFDQKLSRIQKCRNIIKNQKNLRLCEIDEIYTINLVRRLKAKYKNVKFFWLMGADNLENFHRWKNFKEISKEINLAIFSREDFLSKIKKMKSWSFVKRNNPKIFFTKKLDISSTKIREKGNCNNSKNHS